MAREPVQVYAVERARGNILQQDHRVQLQAASQDLNSIALEISRLEDAAQRCLEGLQQQAEQLRERLADASAESLKTSEAAGQRRAALREELRTLPQVVPGGFNGPTWAAMEAERELALSSRMKQAELLRVDAAHRLREQQQIFLARLQDVRKVRREAEARCALLAQEEGYPASGQTWRARFEAMISAQHTAAERAWAASVGGDADRLDQSLAAAEASLREADGAATAPDHLIGALSCVQSLAEAERRRQGLLTEGWLQLQLRMRGSGYSLSSPRGHFSPPRSPEWDLAQCLNSAKPRDS